MIKQISFFFAFTVPMILESGHSEDSNQTITSPAGFEASWENPDDGYSVLSLSKHGKKISEIDGARPVSFSPCGNILLVREARQDDDSRHYLLNLGAGEYRKEWVKGRELRIGGRFVVGASWSEDGRTITLKNADFIGGTEVIEVSQYCRQAPLVAEGTIKVTPADKDDCDISVSNVADGIIIDVKSKSGIGRATIELDEGEWPDTLTFRLHLRGLEGLKVIQGKQNIADQQQAIAYLKDGSVFQGKYLKSKDGYYQVDIPKTQFQDKPAAVKLHWVDFYR